MMTTTMMMQWVVLTFVLVLTAINSAISLQCYVCKGQDCTTTKNCSGGNDTCFYNYNRRGPGINRMCIQNKTCNGVVQSCNTGILCVAKCCHSDLCNKDGPTMAPFPTKPSRKPVVTIKTTSKPNTGFVPIISRKLVFVVVMVTFLMNMP